MPKSPQVSVIIPTTRPEDLARCTYSINESEYDDYEIITTEEIGDLAKVRNNAAKRAKGEYLVFIDDDTIVTPMWLGSIVETLRRGPRIGGVSGPSVIPESHRRNRDLFRYPWLKKIYDLLFLYPHNDHPGRITEAGTFTTTASEETDYSGPVDYLEACNMAVRADLFWEAGGFDEGFKGVGEWEEPDLAFKIRDMGYILWFHPKAKLYHRPSKTGVFKKRKVEARSRYENYCRFSDRWIRKHWRNELYKLWLKTYYTLKCS